MKLTRKGYLVISIFILVLLLSGAIYAYVASQTVRNFVGSLFSQKPNTTNTTPTPNPNPSTSPTPNVNTPVATIADAEIKSNVLQGIMKNPEWRKNEIEIAVSSGVVILRGAVSDQSQSTNIEQFVRSITGVKGLTNSLEVKAIPISSPSPTPVSNPFSTPVSTPTPKETSDELLAKEVEFACYKTDAFEIKGMKFSAKDGEVTLSGKVKTRAEKLLAERIAKDVSGVKSVTNDLEVR